MKNILKILMCSIVIMMMSTMNVYAKDEAENMTNEESMQNTAETEDSEESKEVPSIKKLKKLKITFSKGKVYAYTGKRIKPAVKKITFIDENGKFKELTKGFKIIYTKDSENLEPGKADVTVEIDGYEGEKRLENVFTIVMKKVTSVKAVPLNYHTIKLKWNNVKGAHGYKIYRSTSKNGTYTSIKTITNGSVLEYTCKVPVCGQKYYYKIKAYRKSNGLYHYGTASKSFSGRTTPSRTAFTKESFSRIDSVTLCWKKSSGAEGYKIYRSTKKNSGFECVKTITKADTLKWKDTLENETIYYYKIRPYTSVKNKKVFGSYSKVYAREDIAKKFEEVKKHTYVNYVSGGKSTRGWDCSGFTSWALNYIYGVDIPSYSGSQAYSGKPVNKYDMSKWQPGDILVYSSGGRVNHVALYLGDGEIMHALNRKYDTVIQEVDYYESWDKKNNLCKVRRCF